MNTQSGGMIMLGENQSTHRKTCPSASVHHKSSMHWPGIEPRPPQARNSPDPWHRPNAAGILLPDT
jgi:hypothetical protein